MTANTMKKNFEIPESYRLIIDFGNTLVKIAIFKDDEMLEVKAAPEFDQDLVREMITKFPAHHAIVSSVIETPDEALKFLGQHFKLTILSHTTPIPITNLYKTPETLGRDRLAVAVAASQLFPDEPSLIIDAGTCITFDFTDAAGNYHGGGISPGINMRFKALHTFTQRLPLVKHQNFDGLSGASTKESILSGVLNGVVAEFEGIIGEYEKRYSGLKVLITGGDAKFFAKKLKSNIFAVPNLVLKGLNEILNFNVR